MGEERNAMRRWILILIIGVIFCECLGQEGLVLTDIIFCVSEPANRSYNQTPDPVYNHGDIAWIYCECFRFDYRKEDHKFVAFFDTKLEVYDSESNYIGDMRQSMEIPSTEKPVYVWFKFWIDTANLKEGAYIVRITVKDTLSGKSTVSEGSFSVVE
jgi:hypothetical protein